MSQDSSELMPKQQVCVQKNKGTTKSILQE